MKRKPVKSVTQSKRMVAGKELSAARGQVNAYSRWTLPSVMGMGRGSWASKVTE